MADTRTANEIEAIRVTAEAAGIDPSRWLADEKCDLLEAGRRIRWIQSVRATFAPRTEL